MYGLLDATSSYMLIDSDMMNTLISVCLAYAKNALVTGFPILSALLGLALFVVVLRTFTGR